MGNKKYLNYGLIGFVSVVEGGCEAVFNVPGFLKYLLPVISGFVGAGTGQKNYGPESADIIEGLVQAKEAGTGFVKGAGLSGICEATSFCITKGLINTFS